jgi:hypothetical protein
MYDSEDRVQEQIYLQISAGILYQSMGARNRERIELSYRPARLHRLAEFDTLELIPEPLKSSTNSGLKPKFVYLFKELRNRLPTLMGPYDNPMSPNFLNLNPRHDSQKPVPIMQNCR